MHPLPFVSKPMDRDGGADSKPVLCTGACHRCTPQNEGLPVTRGERTAVCTTCETGGACQEDEHGTWECAVSPGKHKVELRMMCRSCGATDKSKTVIDPQCSVPYEDAAECAMRSEKCSVHRFRAAGCNHVLCLHCLRSSHLSLLEPAYRGGTEARRQEAIEELALMFVADNEGFLVPPCPLCSQLLLPKSECGHFNMHALRVLPRAAHSAAKDVASRAFHIIADGGR
jgi:hypothetical protein